MITFLNRVSKKILFTNSDVSQENKNEFNEIKNGTKISKTIETTPIEERLLSAPKIIKRSVNK